MGKPRIAAAPVYRLGIIADLHCLSRYGLVPPKFRPAQALPSAMFYDYLWECWLDFVKRCPPLDMLIVNGDTIEGESPSRREAMDALTDDLNLQVDAAVETLGLIRDKVKHLWLLRGTPYHEGRHAEAIERIGSDLGAELWAPRRYSGFVLEGEFHGLHLNVCHPVSLGAIYRGTIADRTALFATAAEKLGKAKEADIIIRSHVHGTYLNKVHGKWVLVTRCWKLVNTYAINRMEFYRASLLNDLGGHLLTTTGHGDVTWEPDFQYAPHKVEWRQLA